MDTTHNHENIPRNNFYTLIAVIEYNYAATWKGLNSPGILGTFAEEVNYYSAVGVELRLLKAHDDQVLVDVHFFFLL